MNITVVELAILRIISGNGMIKLSYIILLEPDHLYIIFFQQVSIAAHI